MMTDSTSEGVYPNIETANTSASNSVDAAKPQHQTILFNLLHLLALLAFLWMLVIFPRLYRFVHHFLQRFRYVFRYKGPGHEDLAARIAELVGEKDRMRVSLKNAKHESAVLKEQSTRDKESISLLNTALREAKQPRRLDKTTISRLNTELRVVRRQLSELDNEIIKTQIQRGRAIKRAGDAEYRANLVSDYLLDLKAMGVITGREAISRDDVHHTKADINISATKKTNTATEDIANVQTEAATEKARMEEEHRKALNTATEKIKADATTIENMEAEVKILKAKIQDHSKAVLTRKKSEEEKLTADLANALSDLDTLEAEKKETAADLTKALSSLQTLKPEKEKAEAALIKAMSDLSGVQSDQEKIAADHKTRIAEMEEKAASEKKHIDENWARAKAYTEHIEQGNRNLRNYVCDHTFCRQQLQEQKTKTREALQSRTEAYTSLRQSNDAHENTRQELSSVKRSFNALRTVHNQCKQTTQQPANASNDHLNGPQDEMDVEQPADDKFTDGDGMDVDTPQQILIDRLELSQQKIEELNAQNEKLLEVFKGSRDGADVLGNSRSAAAEERIREEVDKAFKEERGGYLRRIEDQAELLKKKDEALKTNNVSQRLQDDLRAAKEKASKLEFDLSMLQNDAKSKSSTQAKDQAPSAHQIPPNETIQRLKFDLKRLNKETKDAKANYSRVDQLLFKRDIRACEDLRNVEKVRSELGAEIERLEKKIERLESGVGEQPSPAADTTAAGSSGQGSELAGSKRVWDGEGDEGVGGEAVKKLKV